MAVNVPATLWRPTDGNSEMGQAGGVLLTTLAGVQLTTLAVVSLVTLAGSYTRIPATTWAENDAA